MPLAPPPPKPSGTTSLWDDDDEGWQDMPVVRNNDFVSDLDAVDREKYHYRPEPAPGISEDGPGKGKNKTTANATGKLLDFDDRGNEWRARQEEGIAEDEYTRLKLDEEQDEEVHLRTKYLFDEDKAMTPLSQMQATKNLLTEAQRIAYVGVCALVLREMISDLRRLGTAKSLKPATQQIELWTLKIMGRLYYHMELETPEQKMIDSLAEHGVEASDLAPALMTTHTVANPEYDPAQAKAKAAEASLTSDDSDDDDKTLNETPPATPKTATQQSGGLVGLAPPVLATSEQQTLPGVTTSLDATDKDVTLDIRWTVLCDLFLLLIADSVYDARSRVLLERVAGKLSLGWLDVVKFERRVSEALEIQEGVERLEQQEVIEGRMKAGKKKRLAMVGLATIGGGLVIGLSAGLLAPVIGAALGGVLTTIGIGGTTGFLAGAGGAAVITTGGVLAGSGIAGKGMARRTQAVNTFNIIPMHNNRRVNCFLTICGFMNGLNDDVRLPYSVLDPLVGDVFSVLWEPEMLNEMGNALKILTTEALSSLGQAVLQATVMTTIMSAIQWPLLLTKLGYLIDNPWSNALDRAYHAGTVMADILMKRHLGVRPISLIGFSLGARAIFYCLAELAKHKAYGIVQDVVLLGATITAPNRTWLEVRSVVAGRFVNGYARSDWVLNYLFRAASGGAHTVAGLRPVENVPGLENVDVTDKIAGHTSYRTYMPLILHQLGFPVTADYFDEPEDVETVFDNVVVREEEAAAQAKKGWFGRKSQPKRQSISRPPTANSFPSWKNRAASGTTNGAPAAAAAGTVASATTATTAASQSAGTVDDDLPAREDHPVAGSSSSAAAATISSVPQDDAAPKPVVPLRAGFDFGAIQDVIERERGSAPTAGADIHAVPKLSSEPLERSQSTFPYHEAEQDIGTNFGRAPAAEPGRRASWSEPALDEEDEGPRTARPFASPPAMSFAGSDGNMWPAPPPPGSKWTPPAVDRWSPGTSAPRWTPPSTESLSFGGPDGSIATSSSAKQKKPGQWAADPNPWG